MDKNVGSVNLDELKEAREALNKEMGIENDPNMYASYDPEGHKAEKKQSQNGSSEIDDEAISFDAGENDSSLSADKDDDAIIIDEAKSNNETETDLESDESNSETNDSTEDSEVNFNIYDSFADFEVKGEQKNAKESVLENKNEGSKENSATDEELNDNNGNFDKFFEDLDNILSKNTEESSDIETDEFDNGLEKYSVEEEKPTKNDGYNTEVLTDFSKLSELSEELSAETENDATKTEISAEKDDDAESEDENVVDDQKSKSKNAENEFYKTIEPFKFIDIMATEEFKDTDNFSYLLGKNEDGNLVFGNIKDTCGTAYFTRSKENVFSGFSSILISLLLKNSPDNMQFVVCDAMFDSDFDVFENSSYMYFNRVAKNNREIVDTLLELSKEIETRYNNLVFAGVKSIGAYNMQAEERGTEKMPYIVLFLNNYAKMAQFLDNERINTCLYNILKFGRIAGVYVMLASAGEIERNEINFNLPTRIAYKTDDELESVIALGFKGAENLTDDQDFLYSTVFDEEFTHLKVASLTKKEIELIIENLEN